MNPAVVRERRDKNCSSRLIRINEKTNTSTSAFCPLFVQECKRKSSTATLFACMKYILFICTMYKFICVLHYTLPTLPPVYIRASCPATRTSRTTSCTRTGRAASSSAFSSSLRQERARDVNLSLCVLFFSLVLFGFSVLLEGKKEEQDIQTFPCMSFFSLPSCSAFWFFWKARESKRFKHFPVCPIFLSFVLFDFLVLLEGKREQEI